MKSCVLKRINGMDKNELKIGSLQKRAYAEIDLGNADHNFRIIKNLIKPGCKLCCVIKANAYGHGALTLARLYQSLGADMLAVSNVGEAMQVRNGGITLPIFILGYTPAECAALLADNNISQCVYSLEYARELSRNAVAYGVSVKAHIKIDSGMGRIGFRVGESGEDSLEGAYTACTLPGLDVEGIFTHFAVSDEGKDGEDATREQFGRFSYAVCELEKRGVRFLYRHCSNSAAILDYPEYNLDMVRAGVILYGLQPSGKVKNRPDLRPLMTLRSVISHIKTLEPGDRVSYGGEFVAKERMSVATVPIGYADGYLRSNFRAGAKLLVRDKLCPIVGRICMDQLMIDVRGLDRLKIGERVTVFGNGGALTADDIAALNGTINYEICCFLGERVPRVYVRDNAIVSVVDNLMNIV